jgi:hypothetical protein
MQRNPDPGSAEHQLGTLDAFFRKRTQNRRVAWSAAESTEMEMPYP